MVRFFAAGHGDAILLRTHAGAAVLVDAGRGNAWLLGDNLVRRRLLSHLQAVGVHHLDAFIVSHPHPDHFGDLPRLVGRVPIRDIFSNPDGVRALREPLRLTGVRMRMRVWARGDALRLGRLALRVIHPAPGTLSTSGPGANAQENNYSLVLLVRFGRVRFLLTGDLMAAGEKTLLASGAKLRADVLKIGHHGLGSTTEAFLRAVQPRVAVIPCGRTLGRRRDHPDRALLARLARHHVRVLRTDRDGDVIVTSDGVGLTVRTDPRQRLPGPRSSASSTHRPAPRP